MLLTCLRISLALLHALAMCERALVVLADVVELPPRERLNCSLRREVELGETSGNLAQRLQDALEFPVRAFRIGRMEQVRW